ncbi:hypothetical protein M378DRAFT_177701 [Amanita muscaria Koide BX008]|uniref:Extracellular serine-rich protein n=1 Tax=Amanita muscaria (strain Koide BX008) TaxID=946122 RepID=A0A0C2WXM1_AMAMK|nr:hypothetical protein M378DRAFT_177701 [Amanita muscaria Koide BX008]
MQILQSVTTAVVLGLTLPSALSRVFNVEVGPDQAFHPPFISAARRGDSITFTFQFTPKISHSVTQSTFCQPCEHLQTRNSFDSGASGATFTVAVPDARPIYAFSSVGDDCHKGMVFAVNVDQEKYNEFQQRALDQLLVVWYASLLQ